MPDGPRYDDDFYASTQYQAQALRELRTRDNRFDREHLAEEVEDLGNSYRDAVRSQVRRILVQFPKLAHSPADDPRFGRMSSIVDARAQIDDKLSASLRHDIDETLARHRAAARKQATLDLQEYGEGAAARSLPAGCPYTVEQILADDWYPAAIEPVSEARSGEAQ
jgi:hypothetical protein